MLEQEALVLIQGRIWLSLCPLAPGTVGNVWSHLLLSGMGDRAVATWPTIAYNSQPTTVSYAVQNVNSADTEDLWGSMQSASLPRPS